MTFADIRSPLYPGIPSRFVALSGFLNLLALYFSGYLPALFHAGNAFGVQPFRVFPPPSSRVGLIDPPVPSCRSPASLPRLQGLDPEADPLPRPPFSDCTEARYPPGFSSPPGLDLLRAGTPTGSSSHGLLRSWLAVPPTLPFRVLLAKALANFPKPADPPGVSRHAVNINVFNATATNPATRIAHHAA